MASAEEEEAGKLVERARKKLHGWQLFGSKYEECIELYEKAANLYKIAKKWNDAGDCLKENSELYTKMESKHDAATALQSAATCYQKVNVQDAITCLLQSVEMFRELGRFSQVAKLHKEVAEMYEREADLAKAIEHFQSAADFYVAEGQQAGANPCLLRVATMAAQLEDYDKAVGIYEQVSEGSIDNQLLHYSVKEYLMKAALCRFANFKGQEKGAEEMKQHLERYQNLDVTFMDTREAKLLWSILEAFEKQDVSIFQTAVAEYDRISRLDEWKTNILLRIKKKLEAEPDIT